MLQSADQAAWDSMLTEECAVCLITESPVKNTAASAQFTQKQLLLFHSVPNERFLCFVLQAQPKEVLKMVAYRNR